MSVNIPQIANPRLVSTVLPNATAQAIYTATNNLRGILNSMSVCNATAGSVNFTLSIVSPAAVEYKIYSAFPIAANTTLFIKDHEVPIMDGWSLRVQQSSASAALHIVGVIGEITSTRGAQ